MATTTVQATRRWERRVIGTARAIAVLFIVAILAYWLLAYVRQRHALFPGMADAVNGPPPPGALAIPLPTSAGNGLAWYLPPLSGEAKGAPLVIFTHGNAELIREWAEPLAPLRGWGFALLLVEFPGYGGAPGEPTQSLIAETIAAAYDWAMGDPEVAPAAVIAYGRSAGGAAAALLSQRRPLAALILESSWSSVADIARSYMVPPVLVRDRLDNRAAVAAFTGPMLLLHGVVDDIVPPDHARRLHAAAPHARLEWLPCGHNDCLRPWPVVREFLGPWLPTR